MGEGMFFILKEITAQFGASEKFFKRVVLKSTLIFPKPVAILVRCGFIVTSLNQYIMLIFDFFAIRKDINEYPNVLRKR